MFQNFQFLRCLHLSVFIVFPNAPHMLLLDALKLEILKTCAWFEYMQRMDLVVVQVLNTD